MPVALGNATAVGGGQGPEWPIVRGQHGFRHKVEPYDATIRSPLVISMPGRIPVEAVCPHPVAGVDLMATMFAFAGIE